MSKKEIEALKAKVQELEDFKKRVEQGQRWLLCAIYALGGLVGFVYTTLSIIKDWPFGSK